MFLQDNNKTLLAQIKSQLSAEFDDGTPFLLFPVRIETRFMEVEYPTSMVDTWTLNSSMANAISSIDAAKLTINGFLNDGPLDESARATANETLVSQLGSVASTLGALTRVVASEKYKLEADGEVLLAKVAQFANAAVEYKDGLASDMTTLTETNTESGNVVIALNAALAAASALPTEETLPTDAFYILTEHIGNFNTQMAAFENNAEIDLPERMRALADFIINAGKITGQIDNLTGLTEEDYGTLETLINTLFSHHMGIQESLTGVLSTSQALYNELDSLATSLQAKEAAIRTELNGLGALLSESETGDVPDGVAPGFITAAEPTSAAANAQELWVRIYPDEVMVDTHEEDLTQIEINAGEHYWTKIWNYEADEVTLLMQWNVLVGKLGVERAAWVKKQTTPTNLIDRPAGSPIFPVLTPAASSWGSAVHSDVMPDRFVVIAYDAYGTRLEWLGRPITVDPLPAGFDPSTPDAFQWDSNGDLEMDPAIKWMVDFDTAYQMGMGIRVPLELGEETRGFRRLMVLGLRMSEGVGNHATAGKQALEQLFDNHHYSYEGVSFLPQGTPTNNTEESRAGYLQPDEGNALSYATECKDPLFSIESDYCDKTDGQWMAEALGIDHTVFEHIRHADGFDVRDAMAMNHALWPATIGFFLEHLMDDIAMDKDMAKIRKLRDFFTSYISARGFIPAFRVRNQPYGILATTAYSKWTNAASMGGTEKQWHDDYRDYVLELESYFWGRYLAGNQKIRHIHWERAEMFPPGIQRLEDQQANFLNVLGLNPTSIEFFQRHGVSQGSSGSVLTMMANVDPEYAPFLADSKQYGLMTLFYYLKKSVPYLKTGSDLIQSVFVKDHVELDGPLIDINPLSEARKLRETDGKNYIQHLLDSSVVRIRGNSFANDIGDNALLFLFLRQAVLNQNNDSAMDLLDDILFLDQNSPFNIGSISLLTDNPAANQYDTVSMDLVGAKASDFKVGDLVKVLLATNAGNNGVFEITRTVDGENDFSVEFVNPNAVAEATTSAKGAPTADYGYGTAARKDKNALARFNYTKHNVAAGSEVISPWKLMLGQIKGYGDFPTVFMEPVVYLNHYLDTAYHYSAKNYLKEVRKGMEILECLTTAQLERAFVEHLDLCAYRMDGWKQGMVNKRLQDQRSANADGIFLGAFAWVENLEPAPLEDVPVGKVPEGYETDSALKYDSKNQGYIHAPSIPHATAAAMLRSGYFAHSEDQPGNENIMAVNLSSERVRMALNYINGIRHGQGMEALLGYQFERGLHDSQLEMDQYILEMRKIYPLTASSAEIAQFGVSVETIEANQVLDGHALLQNARDPQVDYPYGITGLPDPLGLDPQPEEAAAIIAEVTKMKDAVDAVADLAIADSVYAASNGNFDRAAAMMDSITQGKIPPVPQIQDSHRTGRNLTNRVAMLFEPVETPLSGTPRTLAEPSLNLWLTELLGNLANYKVRVYADGNSSPINEGYPLTDFGIDAIDLMYLLPDELVNDAKTLTKLIGYHVKRNESLNDDVELEIRFMERGGLWTSTDKTLVEMIPLLSQIKNLVTSCRGLHQEDFSLTPITVSSTIATNPREYNLTQLRTRIDAAIGQESGGVGISGLKLVRENLLTAHAALDAQTSYTTAVFDAVRTALIAAVDYGVPNVVPGSANGTSDDIKATLLANATHAITEIESRIEEVENILAAVDLTTPVEQVLSTLQKVQELQKAAKRLFANGFNMIPLFTLTNTTAVNLAIAQSDAILPALSADRFPMDDWLHGTAKVRERMGYFEAFTVMADNFEMPLGTSNWELHLNPVQIPYNPLDSTGAANTTNYWMALKYPDTYDVDENILSLAIQYYGSKPKADPVVALTPLSGTYQCGLLVDEWAELIPNKQETTGIAFHYDKPDAKPAQSLLLCVTPVETGQWEWEDLLDTLNETFDDAKKRAVEPDHFSSENEYQNTGLDTLLPALVADLSVDNSTLSLDFGENVGHAMYPIEFTDNNGLIENHEAARDSNGQII